MRIINKEPPNMDAIDAAFHVRGKPVIFAYGDTIYNPQDITIPPQLVAHEEVHGARQEKMGVANWWEYYISNDYFRLYEEAVAHEVEWQAYQKLAVNRHQRRAYFKLMVQRLTSDLYGVKLSHGRAKRIIKLGAEGLKGLAG